MDIAALDQLRIVLDPAGQLGLAAALMLVIFGVALGLKVSDFLLVFKQPVWFIGAAVTQIIGLPLLTFAIISAVSVPPSIALGMIVVACCPGGAVSNLFTFLARGNVAFSVALTATSSVLAALLTPASILFWSHLHGPTSELLQSVEVDPITFVVQTTFLLAVPIVLGMLLAARAPDVAEKLRRRTALLGSLVLGGVVFYGCIRFFPVLWPALPYLLTVAVLHNAAAFVLGASVGKMLRADGPVRRAMAIEVGIQNSGLALVILVGQLKGLGGAAAIAAAWGIWHLVAGGLIVTVLRSLDRRHAG